MATQQIPEHDPCREQVRAALSTEIEHVETAEQADAVLRRLAQGLAAGTTGEVADSAARIAEAQPPATAVEQAGDAGSPMTGVAATLAAAAAQGVAPTDEAPAVAVGASDVLGVDGVGRTAAAERGRQLLRDALLRQMGPLQALDARLFLAVNGLPRTAWSNKLADAITISTTGGWIWVLGLVVARALGARAAQGALHSVAPAVLGATFIVEHPIKGSIRRRRPFIDVVRALVIGRRPDGWSFPSGHTAAAFAGALMLSHVWPLRAPLFFLGAGTVGFSRVYVGAHYPGDVLAGATLGMALAEAIRQVVRRVGD